jgi:hypothetical protein
MDQTKIIEFLEIVFWKTTIQLMSLSRNLLVFSQPLIDFATNQHTKKVLLRSATLAGSGLTLGFALGFLRAILR